MKMIDKYCHNHNKITNKYCIKCKLYICDQCNNHGVHQLIELDDIISTTTFTDKK